MVLIIIYMFFPHKAEVKEEELLWLQFDCGLSDCPENVCLLGGEEGGTNHPINLLLQFSTSICNLCLHLLLYLQE